MAITTTSTTKHGVKPGDLESIQKNLNDAPLKKPAKRGGISSDIEITDDLLKKIEAQAERGMTRKHIQDYHGISEFKWAKKSVHKVGFEKSYLKGRASGISFTAGKLMDEIKKGNLDAIKFFLSRIAKYSEAPESDTNEPKKEKPKRLIISVTDPIEAAKIYQEFMRGSSKNE